MLRELTIQVIFVHFYLMCGPAVCLKFWENFRNGCISAENEACCKISKLNDTPMEYCCRTNLGNYPIYKDKFCCKIKPKFPYCCGVEDCCDLPDDKIPETRDLCGRRKERKQQKVSNSNCLETRSGISYLGHVSFADDKDASKCMQWPSTNTTACRHDPATGDMQCLTTAKEKMICNLTRCSYPAQCATRIRRGSWEYNRSCVVVDNRTVCPTTELAQLNESDIPWVACPVHEEIVQCITANQSTATIACRNEEYIAVVRAAMITNEKIKNSWCVKQEFSADTAVTQAPSTNVTSKVREMCDDERSACLIRPVMDLAELHQFGNLEMLYVDYVCQSRTPREAGITPKDLVKTYNISLPSKGEAGLTPKDLVKTYNLSLPSKGCLCSELGLDYDVKFSYTKSGFRCANWSTLDDNAKREMKKYNFMYGIDEAGDYCRNPSASPSGPWCYTFVNSNATTSELQRETCDIPQCAAAPTNVSCSDVHRIRSCNESYIELNCEDPLGTHSTIQVHEVKLIDSKEIGETAKCLRSGAEDDPNLRQKIAACSSQNTCHLQRSHSNVVFVKYECVPNSSSEINWNTLLILTTSMMIYVYCNKRVHFSV